MVLLLLVEELLPARRNRSLVVLEQRKQQHRSISRKLNVRLWKKPSVSNSLVMIASVRKLRKRSDRRKKQNG